MHGFDWHITLDLAPMSTAYYAVPTPRKRAGGSGAEKGKAAPAKKADAPSKTAKKKAAAAKAPKPKA